HTPIHTQSTHTDTHTRANGLVFAMEMTVHTSEEECSLYSLKQTSKQNTKSGAQEDENYSSTGEKTVLQINSLNSHQFIKSACDEEYIQTTRQTHIHIASFLSG